MYSFDTSNDDLHHTQLILTMVDFISKCRHLCRRCCCCRLTGSVLCSSTIAPSTNWRWHVPQSRRGPCGRSRCQGHRRAWSPGYSTDYPFSWRKAKGIERRSGWWGYCRRTIQRLLGCLMRPTSVRRQVRGWCSDG